eukprot:TRINITY_DN56404_c0_g1_i1.p1 TRINITY_DN56404_c0_g1~~TRINITY_DN56404_c0_g1_i1.p1  ORF type:complete len:560 (+),score=155.06 TRINITY_DN56404_c0_g1_i1:93-1772(+)
MGAGDQQPVQGVVYQGYPPQGPPQGYPPHGPPQGYPPQGYPPQGYPPPGYPPQGMPPPQSSPLVHGQYVEQPDDEHRGDFTGKYDPHNGMVVTGTPMYPDVPMSSDGRQRFILQGYKDVWAMVAFLLCLIVTLALCGLAFTEDDPTNFDLSEPENETDSYKAYKRLGGEDPPLNEDIDLPPNVGLWIMASCGMAVGGASVMMLLMRAYPQQFIIFANVLLCVWLVALFIYQLSRGRASFITLLLAAFSILWLYLVRHRIPFASLLLQAAIGIICQYKAVCVVAIAQLGVLVGYVFIFMVAVKPFLTREQEIKSYNHVDGVYIAKRTTHEGNVGVALLLLFFLFWTFQVVAGIVHVTACGVAATWFFFSGTQMPRNPTAKSLKRASTTSLGSICFGSLIVAILKLIKFLVQMMNDDRNGALRCIILCILNCLDSIMRYFNKWAFAQCAIYGKSYCEAAQATFRMMKDGTVWEGVIADCLVDPALGLCNLMCAGAVGLIVYLAASNVVLALVCALITVMICQVMLGTVDSCIIAIFVCFAEAKDALQASQPQLYAGLMAQL